MKTTVLAVLALSLANIAYAVPVDRTEIRAALIAAGDDIAPTQSYGAHSYVCDVAAGRVTGQERRQGDQIVDMLIGKPLASNGNRGDMAVMCAYYFAKHYAGTDKSLGEVDQAFNLYLDDVAAAVGEKASDKAIRSALYGKAVQFAEQMRFRVELSK